MSSSLHKKPDSPLRLVSDEEAVVYPDDARPSDDTPTVISKTVPIVEPAPSSQNKQPNTAIKAGSPESIVEGLRGRRLAHYELIEPIGVGGMAAVIRARDTQLDRIVALKILPPEMAKEPDNIQRFHQEAKAAAKLDHANIGRVFYCGEDQGLHFIAFEYVEGMNLRAMLEKRGKLPVAEAIRYIVQIATGLEHAVSRGVVHRDVKPSNIIITPQGQAKLVDMGLARNLERNNESDLTQSGMTLGTFDYISPEQALEPREADARSDIYSLGCTLYHLLTGQPPVPDGTPAKKLDHHQHQQPTDPQLLNPEIPDEIVTVLGTMMKKDPKDRYQTPIQVVHQLVRVAQRMGETEGMPEVMLFTDTPLPSEPGRRPALYIGLALLALVALILGLSLAPDPARNGTARTTPPNNDNGPTPSNPVRIVQKVDSPPNAIRPKVVRKLADLQSVLGDRESPVVNVKIEGAINLESAGLVFQGTADQKLVMEPYDNDPASFATIRFRYKSPGALVGLALLGGREAEFKRIHFEIISEETPEEQPAAALAIRGIKSVKLDRCTFTQSVPPISRNRVPMASILIDAPQTAEFYRPDVILRKCYLNADNRYDGQVAVAVNGAASIEFTNVAFRPHGAFFSFRDKCRQEKTSLTMRYCSGFVEKGPAFRFSKDASALVKVAQSAFLRPSGTIPVEGLAEQPGLIYLVGDSYVRYEGQQNLYYNLNALLDTSTKRVEIITKAADFNAYLQKNNGFDENPLLLPFEPSPLQLETPLGSLNNLAFQFKQPYYRNFGLQDTWMGSMPEPPVAVAKALKKIVDPDNRAPKKDEKIYLNLASALSEAADVDVIYIKCGASNEVKVPAADLKGGKTVTLRPYEGFDPILVLDKSAGERDSYLFKIQRATLQIEQMKILLAPSSGYDLRSVICFGDSAQVVFKKCRLDLRPGNGDGKLNIVTLIDLDKSMMKTDAPGAPPKVEFHQCFIRGKGDLIALRGARKLSVDMDNSLVALDGSLLDIDAGFKEMAPDQGVQWNMARSSVFTGKPIFALRSINGKGLAESNAKVKDCLLVCLAADPPLPVAWPADANKLKKYLKWQGEHNFYVNYFKSSLPDDMDPWTTEVIEPNPAAAMLTFPKQDIALQALWDATPDMFKPMESEQKRLNGFGMPPALQQKLLPAPPAPPEPDQP